MSLVPTGTDGCAAPAHSACRINPGPALGAGRSAPAAPAPTAQGLPAPPEPASAVGSGTREQRGNEQPSPAFHVHTVSCSVPFTLQELAARARALFPVYIWLISSCSHQTEMSSRMLDLRAL